MKLFNQFSNLPRYLNEFNYAGEKIKKTPKELEKCHLKLGTSGEKNSWNIQLKIIVWYIVTEDK